ncbi:bifunctional phosphopantothenoylcysteine decarboxylase/phosphopantothenate--cysteine ligase CoaBC [Methylotenera sp.]|uniref:bifunctional phosphopantothenoylcysteine decarboxylase/phosphopantothenate--cysteine ligase CoaBC n=1 Tax=Methylotenera sp. TaxID=2051956 RepID=UPI002735605A|nr:bifunctional phosphopantothenoylcysteine decarboxylase/phosphopantothenate--cysteine ligase CoaBC [Methylotenera sp.]MDP3210809.1 bifunctional phosphopantothenoylcysteine decarboxylase/phosphopantothenate--cysteine ligase CoaBC [Methylotenera sp.]MDP3778132.1 bifunctional phosphopantothenoylcysteine decarboxylase/phosphopantothenate--cysteine ligase CoaBC [Methylotenera sp.]
MQNKKSIVLGITGGIAAYKAAELVRLFVKNNIDVQVVMTQAACQFISTVTMQALSGKPVFTDMWDASIPNGMPHIELSRAADAIVIAPASADFIAKLVHGRADDLLSTLCLARDCDLLVAPAMNKQMWENPATQRNIAQLVSDGIHILGPDSGEQACGEIGLGRMLEAEDLHYLITAYFQPKRLRGKKILITAGATLEMIDPVRAITNLSSGKMGYAIAQAAFEMGAEVTLISGATVLAPPTGVRNIAATSAGAMYQSVMQNIANQDIFIGVAAVADYSPANSQSQKIKKSEQSLTLELKLNKDILAEVASLPNPPFCVGFAAETENLLEFAEAKRQKKKLPLIVANLTSDAMGSDNNKVILLDNNGNYPLEPATKIEVARSILKHVADMLQVK